MTIIQRSKRIRRATARHLDGLQMGYIDYCNAVSTSTEFYLATDLFVVHEDTLVLNNQRMSNQRTSQMNIICKTGNNVYFDF